MLPPEYIDTGHVLAWLRSVEPGESSRQFRDWLKACQSAIYWADGHTALWLRLQKAWFVDGYGWYDSNAPPKPQKSRRATLAFARGATPERPGMASFFRLPLSISPLSMELVGETLRLATEDQVYCSSLTHLFQSQHRFVSAPPVDEQRVVKTFAEFFSEC